MIRQINTNALPEQKAVVLDVRSPGEYKHAHIPFAHSLPLFSDEERAIIGIAYKQQSRQEAVKKGLSFFSGKMLSLIADAENICKKVYGNNNKNIIVHCWRGGMRSSAVAWLLDLYGFNVSILSGGYKSYRKWSIAQFEKDYPFILLGGFSGSGKTKILNALDRKEEVVICLESLASHHGSAFGNLGMPQQPSQEMFENMLALELYNKNKIAAEKNTLIWIEDESRRIGDLNLPSPLFENIRAKQVLFLQIPFNLRVKNILNDYGNFDKERIANGIERVKKRLGPLETKKAFDYLNDGELEKCFSVLLQYYDKYYKKSMQLRLNWQLLVKEISVTINNSEQIADELMSLLQHELRKT